MAKGLLAEVLHGPGTVITEIGAIYKKQAHLRQSHYVSLFGSLLQQTYSIFFDALDVPAEDQSAN